MGSKYIAYYEYISFVINSFERPSNISSSEEIDFFLSTLKVAYKLQFGQNADIVVSQDYFDKSQSIIAKYKTYIPNSSFGAVLDDISNDLVLYKNNSKATVISSIQ